MTVPGNLSSPLLATATGAAAAATEYVIPKSLRFNDGDSAHLKRDFSIVGNRKTFTFSCWLKRSTLGANQAIFTGRKGTTQSRDSIRFESNDTLLVDFNDLSDAKVYTSQVFRDCSSFYHLVVAVDTTQSTAADRIKIYVNGSEVEYGTTTYPSQNYESNFNSAQPHGVGLHVANPQQYFDGLMADIQFVDGQALAPTDFGETRSSDGVWVPKEYATTFQLASGTPTTANGGIVIKADGSSINGTFVVNGGVKTWTSPDGQTWTRNGEGRSTAAAKYLAVGGAGTATKTFYPDAGSGNYTYFVYNGNEFDGSGSSLTLDLTSQTYIAPSDSSYGLNGFHLNFSDSSTNEALGFDSAPTTPDPDPKKGFDVVTYTGNGGTQNIGGLNFEPGLIWLKSRSESARSHSLYDNVRGASKVLKSDNTDSETKM